MHGEIVPHIALKRIGVVGGWQKSRTLSARHREALGWYCDQLAVARSGLTRSSLAFADSGTGGGGGRGRTESQIIAGDNVSWARRFVPVLLLVLFDAIVEHEMSFAEAGQRYWPMLGSQRAQRIAASQFSVAAGSLAEGLERNGIIK